MFLIICVFIEIKLYAMPSNEKLIPGVYQHYKGSSYLVFVTAEHTETEENLVVYTNLAADPQLWVRPAAMFNEKVEVDGTLLPRFKFIRPLHHSERLQIYL